MLEGVQQRVVTLLCIGKEVDEGGDVVVHHQRQVGVGGGQIGPGPGHNIRVHHEGHILGHIGRRLLFFGHKAIAQLQRLHLQRIHRVHNAVELLLQLCIALDIDATGQHQVHGAIELSLGFGQLTFAIGGLAMRVCVFHMLNKQGDTPLLERGRWRRGGIVGL